MTKAAQNVIPAGETAVAAHTPTPLEILAKAMDRGIPVEQIKLLQEMQREWEANEARKAFNAAMAAFRAEVIPILKTRQVDYGTGSNRVRYLHETLDIVLDAAVPKMSPHKLFHHWDTEQDKTSRLITVTCIVAHALGHSIRVTLSGMPDETGSKNKIQAVGSTVKYLERYTFMAATGLAAKGHDTDGRPPEPDAPDTISEAQATILSKLIKDTGTKLESFLGFAKIEKVDDLPASRFAECKDMLDRRKANQQSKGSK